MNIKLIIGIVILMSILPLVGGSIGSYGYFEKDTCFEIKQICFINGSICDVCNITSIDFPNGSRGLNNIVMNRRSGDFNYTYCSSDALGRYNVNGYCTYVSDVKKPFVVYFDVTPNGEEPTTSKSILYIGLIFSLILFFCISLWGLLTVENIWGRFALFWVSYLFVIAVSFTIWDFGLNFLTGTPFLTAMSRITFYVLLIGMFPVMLMSLAWVIYIHTVTGEMKDMMEKGMSPEEAWTRRKTKLW